MRKREVVDQIMTFLAEELSTMLQAAKAAREAATSSENKAENQYDTRGLEASYLAGAQAARAAEIQQQLLMYKYLPLRDFTDEDVVVPSALVEVELNGTRSYLFMAPQGGGLITRVDGKPIQVVTPQSPIGDALLGKRAGDLFEVEIRASTREYRVISVR